MHSVVQLQRGALVRTELEQLPSLRVVSRAAERQAMVGKAVIAIAHRLSTVMDMDRLVVLDRGNIVADGSHRELLDQGGLYAELWRKQSGGFNPVARAAAASDQSLELGELEELAASAIET